MLVTLKFLKVTRPLVGMACTSPVSAAVGEGQRGSPPGTGLASHSRRSTGRLKSDTRLPCASRTTAESVAKPSSKVCMHVASGSASRGSNEMLLPVSRFFWSSTRWAGPTPTTKGSRLSASSPSRPADHSAAGSGGGSGPAVGWSRGSGLTPMPLLGVTVNLSVTSSLRQASSGISSWLKRATPLWKLATGLVLPSKLRVAAWGCSLGLQPPSAETCTSPSTPSWTTPATSTTRTSGCASKGRPRTTAAPGERHRSHESAVGPLTLSATGSPGGSRTIAPPSAVPSTRAEATPGRLVCACMAMRCPWKTPSIHPAKPWMV